MKRVFILLPLLFLFLVLSEKAKAEVEVEGIFYGLVITKGGKIEKGGYSYREGYVIVGNKAVRGKALKQGAWLRSARRDKLGRKAFRGTYYILDAWHEGGNSIMAEVKCRNWRSTTYICTSYEPDRWRVVKN